MKNTIYNVFVKMESQDQCDRMKQLCIDNGLPIWKQSFAWKFGSINNIFGVDQAGDFFILINNNDMKHTQVTEQEFINLLK